MSRTRSLAVASVLACGCGNTPSTTTGDGGTPADAGPFEVETFTVEFGPIDVEPGMENTQCVIVPLGNDADVFIGNIKNVLETTSHHMIVYRTNAAVQLEPFDCDPFTDTLDPANGNLVMISQKADDELVLPDGVALRMAAGQNIRLELHFINASFETAQAHATSTFTTMPAEDVVHEADLAFIGNPDISIPPQSTHSIEGYLPMPAEFADANFFAITGHTHQYGTNVTIHTAQKPADTVELVDEVYAPENYLWEEPPTIQHSPPFSIPAGGGFNFSCEWNNTSDFTVEFGEDFNDEMCFFWAYYYPSLGSKVCIHTEQGDGYDLCCPGDSLCALVLAALESGSL